MVTCGNFMVQAYIYSTKEVFHTGEGNFKIWNYFDCLSHDSGFQSRYDPYGMGVIVKMKKNCVPRHVCHGHLISIAWLIVTEADLENLIYVKRWYYLLTNSDESIKVQGTGYYWSYFQFQMDDEETIYSTEIQLEIGELKVVEEEIVYTWGNFLRHRK